ncbi:MAG: hypothetical protein WBD40_04865 [Tepidisphaeraceae bacterium]
MTEQPKRRRIKKRWILLIVVVVLAFAAMGAHLIWTASARRKLDAQIAEYKSLGEPIEPNDFAGYGVVPGENAVPDLQAAARLIDRTTPAWDAFKDAQLSPPFPLRPDEIQMLRALVGESNRTFPLVKSASKLAGVDWKLSFQGPVTQIVFQDFNGYRDVTSVLHCDALLAHAEGDDTRAIKRASELLFLSRVMGKQPTFMSNLVSIAIAAIASQVSGEVGPELRIGTSAGEAPPQQVRDLIAQLLDETHTAQSQQDGLLGERMLQLTMVRSMADGTISAMNGQRAAGRSLKGYVLTPTFLDDARLLVVHITALRQAAAASPDLPTFRQQAPKVPSSVQSQRWRHLAANLLIWGVDRAVETNYRAVADRRLAATALAARMYAVDHGGKLPPSLDALVPGYLPEVPRDPTSAGQPLHYTSDDPDPRIWTLGENGRDDGGRDIVPTESARWNKENTDRVVHLRRQPRPEPPEPLDDGIGGYSTDPSMAPGATAPALP